MRSFKIQKAHAVRYNPPWENLHVYRWYGHWMSADEAHHFPSSRVASFPGPTEHSWNYKECINILQSTPLRWSFIPFTVLSKIRRREWVGNSNMALHTATVLACSRGAAARCTEMGKTGTSPEDLLKWVTKGMASSQRKQKKPRGIEGCDHLT